MPPPLAHARGAAGDARLHHGLAVGVERGERGERGQRLGREDVRDSWSPECL